MITPVENGSTCSGAMPMRAASAAQVERARARPSAPVPALALPVLTRMRADALAGRQVLAAQLHRRGAEAVAREDAGDAAAFGERHHRQVAAVGLAHAGHGHADARRRARRAGTRIGATRLTGMAALAAGGAPIVRKHAPPARPPPAVQASLPWQFLYFLPLPQGQGSLRPTLGTLATAAAAADADRPRCDTLPSSFGWV